MDVDNTSLLQAFMSVRIDRHELPLTRNIQLTRGIVTDELLGYSNLNVYCILFTLGFY